MTPRKPLGDLIAETPGLIVDLFKAEIARLKAEIAGKAKGLGVGGALLAVAGVFGLFLLGWLLVAAFEGLNEAFAPWLSALLVSAFLLIITAALVLIGLGSINRSKDFSNLEAVDSIKDDVNMVRGLGHAADGTDPLDDIDMNGAQR
ncbi:phage holin family protein [Agrococcus carbonis]|uniref:Putative Holin-X, holin superfamily III n=1 Tax=Agrococcus carbonis TaxID=684552 RepID=A0A1H1P261_9MICO|nr:phage holin family protein [Agrococcus carbonis]SDS05294.1 Putative Holin-X, holin superfamily III [Agrococcus carbonis]